MGHLDLKLRQIATHRQINDLFTFVIWEEDPDGEDQLHRGCRHEGNVGEAPEKLRDHHKCDTKQQEIKKRLDAINYTLAN